MIDESKRENEPEGPNGNGTEPEGAIDANGDVLEIDVELEKDRVETIDDIDIREVQVKVRVGWKLKLGVGIVVFSFVMSLVGAPLLIVCGCMAYAAECYAASWGVLLLGIVIGGREAYEIVKSWKMKLRHAVARKLKSRKKAGGSAPA